LNSENKNQVRYVVRLRQQLLVLEEYKDQVIH